MLNIDRRTWRRLGKSAVVFFALFAFLGLPYPDLRDRFSRAYQDLGNFIFSEATIGRGGQFRLAPGHADAGPDSDASWDAALVLSVKGSDERSIVIINPRRLAYLPMLLVFSLVAASWLSFRGKVRCLFLGIPLALVGSYGLVYALVWCAFAMVPGLVYDFGETANRAVLFLYSAVVSAPVIRWLGPALLASGLIFWQGQREMQQRHSRITQ